VKNTLRTPHFLTLIASLGLLLAPVAGCEKDPGTDAEDETTTGDGDGDGDMTGDGDGDPTGDGDGDPTGDGDGDPTGDGDGEPMICEPGFGGAPNGATCTSSGECDSCNCYVVPFLGGQCGECDNVEGDMDCAEVTGGGCTPPNPFENNGSTCNMGEAGGGCMSTDVCMEGLLCGNVLSLLGVVEINTCGECATDADCTDPTLSLCAPVVVVEEFSGLNTCIEPKTLENNMFCNLEGNGDEACANVCSTVDIMGLAMIGACGDCNTDADCTDPGAPTCQAGEFDLEAGTLGGSACVP
jgi:hypothetical protein